jgi:hypothetical protein
VEYLPSVPVEDAGAAADPLTTPDRLKRAQLFLAITASCSLAYVIPYDVLFDRATANIGIARAFVMLLCWLAGLWLQRANGFSLRVVNLRSPTLKVAGAALGIAIWCIVLDGVVFRSILPAPYHSFEQQPLGIRLLYYCSRAFNENVLYRLFLGSLLAWLFRNLLRKPELAVALSVLGMAIAQLVNVAANMSFAGFSPETSLWLLLRFGVPETVWGWLYVRHGFVANEAAAIGVHCILQPLVSVAF